MILEIVNIYWVGQMKNNPSLSFNNKQKLIEEVSTFIFNMVKFLVILGTLKCSIDIISIMRNNPQQEPEAQPMRQERRR
jgi:hypothetical protein